MIAIYEDQGGDLNPDDYEPTALYDGSEWVAGGDEWEPYYPEGTPEETIAAQIDGPDPVAVEVTEGSDELLSEIEKTTDPEPVDGETSDTTERENDGHGDETDPPWATASETREKTQNNVGGLQSTLLDVGNDVTVADEDEEDDEGERKSADRVYVDTVSDAPEDKVVQTELDDDGNAEALYYEP